MKDEYSYIDSIRITTIFEYTINIYNQYSKDMHRLQHVQPFPNRQSWQRTAPHKSSGLLLRHSNIHQKKHEK